MSARGPRKNVRLRLLRSANKRARFLAMLEDGDPVRAAAESLGIPISTAHLWNRKAKQEQEGPNGADPVPVILRSASSDEDLAERLDAQHREIHALRSHFERLVAEFTEERRAHRKLIVDVRRGVEDAQRAYEILYARVERIEEVAEACGLLSEKRIGDLEERCNDIVRDMGPYMNLYARVENLEKEVRLLRRDAYEMDRETALTFLDRCKRLVYRCLQRNVEREPRKHPEDRGQWPS